MYIIGVVDLTQTGVIVSQRQPNRMLAAYICMAMGFFVFCYSVDPSLPLAAVVAVLFLACAAYVVSRPATVDQDGSI